MRECGEILGVTSKLAPESRDAKHILEHIFAQVVEFKKLNQVWLPLSILLQPYAYISDIIQYICSNIGKGG